jgi:hypothetical protein
LKTAYLIRDNIANNETDLTITNPEDYIDSDIILNNLMPNEIELKINQFIQNINNK